MMTIFAVKLKEAYGDPRPTHIYLMEAKNKYHAKNLAETKWYESHPNSMISEGETEIWEIEQDYANNPSVRG